MDAEKLFNLVSNDTLKNGVCRVCLQENVHLFNIFESSYNVYEPIATIFENFFSQKITPGDGYPEVVCPNCLDQGVKALEFKAKFNKASVKVHSENYFPEIEEEREGIILIVQSDDGECVQYVVKDVKQEVTTDDNQQENDEDNNAAQIKHEDYSTIQTNSNTLTNKFFCQKCGIPFFTTGALAAHMKDCLSCDICNVSHTNIPDYNIHQKFHVRVGETRCPHCGEVLKRGYHSVDNFKFACTLCDFVFPCTIYLDHHIKFQHKVGLEMKREPEYNANNCKEVGKNSSREYKCNFCDKTFSNSIRANIHTSSMSCVHRCDTCGANYKVKSQLRMHIMDKHLHIRPHLCCVCGKSFVRKGMLKSHQQVHLREKNYVCNICDKKFVSAATLRYHSRLHTGEKPYVCSICGEGFVKCSRLREHEQKWHIGKLQCPKCMTTFSQRCSLKFHMDRFHPNTYDRKEKYLMINEQTYQQDNVEGNIVQQSGILIPELNTMYTIHITE